MQRGNGQGILSITCNQRIGLFAIIHSVVANVPEGSVATYGQIAAMVGIPRGARTVVWALKCSPPGLPCHRVVTKDGSLAPVDVFSGTQRSLLEGEGISFLPEGRIDMSKHQWVPAELEI